MAVPTLEELDERFLVTADGDTPGRPCGVTGVCNYNDRVQWTERVKAIETAVLQTLSLNKSKVAFSSEASSNAIRFVSEAFFLKRYPSLFDVSHTPKELAEMAQRGVGALHALLEEAEAEGGTLPNFGPSPTGATGIDLFPGPDAVWWVGIGAAALLALYLWRR